MVKQDLYVLEIGSVIKKKGENFLISNNGNKILELSHRKINRIFLVGSQSITPEAISFALDKEKDIFFINKLGKIKGTIISNSSKNVFLRISQYEHWRDKEKRLKVAKYFVSKKVRNQIKFLNKQDINISEQYVFNKINKCITINELLGIEGDISKRYFDSFDNIIKSELKFEKRTRRPAKNEFNALLNLTYAMTKNNIINKLEREGVDCYIGYLHSVKYGRESLALDLIEELRISCDKLVIKWINRKEFKKSDFLINEDGIVLIELAFRKYLEKYNDAYLGFINNEIEESLKAFKSLIIE